MFILRNNTLLNRCQDQRWCIINSRWLWCGVSRPPDHQHSVGGHKAHAVCICFLSTPATTVLPVTKLAVWAAPYPNGLQTFSSCHPLKRRVLVLTVYGFGVHLWKHSTMNSWIFCLFFPILKVLVVTQTVNLSQNVWRNDFLFFPESTLSLTDCVWFLLWTSFFPSAKQEQTSPASSQAPWLWESNVIMCTDVPWGERIKHCETVTCVCVDALGWVMWSAALLQCMGSHMGNEQNWKLGVTHFPHSHFALNSLPSPIFKLHLLSIFLLPTFWCLWHQISQQTWALPSEILESKVVRVGIDDGRYR